jgi:hypothetical protein
MKHGSKALIAKLNIVEDLQAALAQFAAVTRVKERPGFPIAADLKRQDRQSHR